MNTNRETMYGKSQKFSIYFTEIHFVLQKMYVFLRKKIKTKENGTSGYFAARKI